MHPEIDCLDVGLSRVQLILISFHDSGSVSQPSKSAHPDVLMNETQKHQLRRLLYGPYIPHLTLID